MHDDSLPPPFEPAEKKPGFGVRRVNNLPILIVAGVLAIFAITVAVVVSKRGSTPRAATAEAGKLVAASPTMAQQVVGDNVGIVAPAAPGLPVPAEMAVPIAQVEGDGPPLPPAQGEDPELERLRVLRMQQLQKALASRSGVLGAVQAPGQQGAGQQQGRPPATGRGAPRGSARNAPEEPSTRDEIEALRSSLAVPSDEDRQPNNDYQQFAGRGVPGQDRWQLDSRVEMPRSPFTLRAGYVIPAVMISGINSDLPGQIIGQVSQDVYDTATGRHRVIPLGTRLVGSYNSDVAYGQRRVLVAWQRLVFPDGRAMDIGSMAGVDSTGYAGFNDKVDNHYLRIFGQAILLSGVIAGVEMSQPDSNINTRSAGDSLSEALGQSLGTVLTQLFRKNLNIAPTLEVRPGFRFNVMVAKDLDFDRPYTPMTY